MIPLLVEKGEGMRVVARSRAELDMYYVFSVHNSKLASLIVCFKCFGRAVSFKPGNVETQVLAL